MLHRYLALVPFPPSLRDPAAPLPPTAHRMKPLIFNESGDEKLPEWIDSLPSLPVVHATLGTAVDRPDLLRTIVDGLADEHVNLILAIGRGRDAAVLGSFPKNVRVAEYIPHTQLLPPKQVSRSGCRESSPMPTRFDYRVKRSLVIPKLN